MADDFLTDNYLSTERRIPVTLLQTNACSPLATNALGGNIWDNFSSQTYKDLPSVGKMTVLQSHRRQPLRIRDAGRRARLYARAVVDQLVVDGAVSAEQLGGQVSIGSHPSKRAWIRSTTRSRKCSGRRSATKIRFSATKCRDLSIARRRRAISRLPPGYLPAGTEPTFELGRLAAQSGFPGCLAKAWSGSVQFPRGRR